MMELKELFMDIRKELRCADKYAHEAVKHKAEFPELSAIYHRIATDKMAHADILVAKAKKMADKHRMVDVWDVEDYMAKHDMEDVRAILEKYR